MKFRLGKRKELGASHGGGKALFGFFILLPPSPGLQNRNLIKAEFWEGRKHKKFFYEIWLPPSLVLTQRDCFFHSTR